MPMDVRNGIFSMVQKIEEYVQDISEEDIPFLTLNVLQSQLDTVKSLLARFETHQAHVISAQFLEVDRMRELSASATFQHRCLTLCDRIEQMKDHLIPKPQSAEKSSTFLMAFDDDIREFMQHREEHLHHLLALAQTASSSSKNVLSEFAACAADLHQVSQLEIASSAPIAIQRHHNAPSESLSITEATHVSGKTQPLMQYTLDQLESEPRAQGGNDCDIEPAVLKPKSTSLYRLHTSDASASLTKPTPAPRTRSLESSPLTAIHESATSCLCCQKFPPGRQPHHQNECTTTKCTRSQERHKFSFQKLEDDVHANLLAPYSLSSSISVSTQSTPVADNPPPNQPQRTTAIHSVSASACRIHSSRPEGQFAAPELMSHPAVNQEISCRVLSDGPEVHTTATVLDSGLRPPNLPSDNNLGIGNNYERAKFRDSLSPSQRTCLPVNPDYLNPETPIRFPDLVMQAEYQPLAIVHLDNLQATRKKSNKLLMLQDPSCGSCTMGNPDVDNSSSSRHGISLGFDVAGELILLPQFLFALHEVSLFHDDALFESRQLIEPDNPSIFQDSPPGENFPFGIFDFGEGSSSLRGINSRRAVVREQPIFTLIQFVHCKANIPLQDDALLEVRTLDSPKNPLVVSHNRSEELKEFPEKRVMESSLIKGLFLPRHSGLSSSPGALPNTMTSELLSNNERGSTWYSVPDDSKFADLLNTFNLFRVEKVLTHLDGRVSRENCSLNLSPLRFHSPPMDLCELKWNLDCPGPPGTLLGTYWRCESSEVLLESFGIFECCLRMTPVKTSIPFPMMCLYPFQLNELSHLFNPIGLRGLPDREMESLSEPSLKDIQDLIVDSLRGTFATHRWTR